MLVIVISHFKVSYKVNFISDLTQAIALDSIAIVKNVNNIDVVVILCFDSVWEDHYKG